MGLEGSSSNSGSSRSASGLSSASPQILPLIVCAVLAHAALTGSRVTVSLTALHHGASALFVGLAIGMFGLFPLLLAVSMGRWVDRIGPQWPMRVGFAIEVVGLAIATFGPYPWALLPAALLIGTGVSMTQLTMQATVGLRFDSASRPQAFAKLAIGASIASFTGPVICGFLIDHVGHRAAFGAMSGLGMTALLWQWWLAKSRPGMFPTPHPHDPAKPRALADLLADPKLRAIFLLSVALAVAWDTFQFIMPIHGQKIGLSASTIGLLLGTFASAIFLVRLLMNHLNRRYASWTILRAVFVVSTLVFVALPFVHSVPVLFAAAFVLGFALGASQSNMLSLLHDAVPPARAGEAIALRQTFGNASSFALPSAFGAAGAVVGFVGLFAMVAVMLTASTAVAHRHARAASV
jgi:predicted MFS family arabinose efflux permease